MKATLKKMLQSALLVPLLAVGAAGVMSSVPVSAQGFDCGDGQSAVLRGSDCATPDAEQRELVGTGGLFETVVNILLFVVGAIAVIMLIIGGIRYVISGGDQNQVTAAKNTILYAIIGIVVALLAFALVNFVTSQIVNNTETAASVLLR